MPEVEFYQCTFNDLDLSRAIFNVNLKFMQCEFKGNTSFEKSVFSKQAYFTRSVFNGITNFNNIIYEKELDFFFIQTKPAKDGYFYFRGDELENQGTYEDHSISFSRAVFEIDDVLIQNFQNATFVTL